MFIFRRTLALCALLAVLTGCTDARSRAERTLREVESDELRRDAAFLYKEVFGGRGAEFQVVPRSAWPRSFQRFKPRRVGAYEDGFSLAIETDADTEQGLYVIPLHLERRVPSRTAGAQFEALAEGIYWYAFAE